MSYLERIQVCSQYNLDNTLPFIIDGEQLGWTQKLFAERLAEWSDTFVIDNNTLCIHPSLKTSEQRSEATAPLFLQCHQEGIIDTWVNELYSVVQNYDEEPRMFVERAATPYLGVKGYGVHINGLVKKESGAHVWVGVRTRNREFWPGKLDQIVAGGQPAGIGLMDNVIKESAEEANIPRHLAEQAEYIVALSYCSEGRRGISPDTIYTYDLWLPEDFIPENTDGEVEEFHLLSLEELVDKVENTENFKDNCNLVNIDLLIRQGVISRQHPDYAKIVELLYTPAMRF